MVSYNGDHCTRNGSRQYPARARLFLDGNGLGPGELHPDTISLARMTSAFNGDDNRPSDLFHPDGRGSLMATAVYWMDQMVPSFQTWGADFNVITNEATGSDNPFEVRTWADFERNCTIYLNSLGLKTVVGSLAGGSPDWDLWVQYVGPLILWAWDNGGNIYGRHIYGGDVGLVGPDGRPTDDPPGIPSRVEQELDWLKAQGYGGGLVLTEMGLNGGYGVESYDTWFSQMSGFYDYFMTQRPDLLPWLIGGNWWERGLTGFEADYNDHLDDPRTLAWMEAQGLPRWTPVADPSPRPKIVIVKKPQISEMTLAENDQVAEVAFQDYGRTTTHSEDDMASMMEKGDPLSSFAYVAWPSRPSQQPAIQILDSRGWNWVPLFEGQEPIIQLTFRPCLSNVITQDWLENPEYYQQYGLPGHEGRDYAVPLGQPFHASHPGTVVHASDRRWSSDTPSAYGFHVVVEDPTGRFCTVYGHGRQDLQVAVGDQVEAGQVLAFSGNTGTSTGPHLHYGVLDKTGTIDPDNGFPEWLHGRPVDPGPWVDGLPAPPAPPTGQVYDMAIFLRGEDGIIYDLEYDVGQTGTQNHQVRWLNPEGTEWILIKGENGEYERLGIITVNGQEWIARFEDTSEAPDRWYGQYRDPARTILGAPWIPRWMTVGQTVVTQKWIQHYWKGSGWPSECTPDNSGEVWDQMTLTAVHPEFTFHQSGQTLLAVAQLTWGQGEDYFFQALFSQVGFRDAHRDFWFMGGPLHGRPDKTYLKPTCVPVGW